jgi:hypothetical protein
VDPHFADGVRGHLAIFCAASRSQPAALSEKAAALCFQATDTAGRLASETDPKEWEKARISFWRLYWGPLSIVKDRGVEAAMVKLGELVPDHAVSLPEQPVKSLGVPSYELAHAVRDLVLTSWKVDLPPLKGKRWEQAR